MVHAISEFNCLSSSRVLSDHHPLLIDLMGPTPNSTCKPFRFEHVDSAPGLRAPSHSIVDSLPSPTLSETGILVCLAISTTIKGSCWLGYRVFKTVTTIISTLFVLTWKASYWLNTIPSFTRKRCIGFRNLGHSGLPSATKTPASTI